MFLEHIKKKQVDFQYVKNLSLELQTALRSFHYPENPQAWNFAIHSVEPLWEHSRHMTMVNKYGPKVSVKPADRLARFAHDASRDGAQMAEAQHSSAAPDGCLWTEGDTDWLDLTDPLANLLPSPPSESGEGGSSAHVG